MGKPLTRREHALATLAGAPLEMDVAVPEKRAAYKRPEADLQAAVVQWLKIRRKRGDVRFVVHAPERKRTFGQQYYSKRAGLEAGVPDILVLVSGAAGLRVVWCELKSPQGKLSPEQVEWAEWLGKNRCEWHCVRSLEQMIAIIGA